MVRFLMTLVILPAMTLLFINRCSAESTPSQVKTTITLRVLDCESCARTIRAKLSEIRGVADVKTDVKSKVAVVVAKKDSALSPLQLWEAIESAGKEPVRLVGPTGTFTTKPKR